MHAISERTAPARGNRPGFLALAAAAALAAAPAARAGEAEPAARGCVERAERSARAARPAEAAAWYRAAAACYRYLAIPVRKAQIEYFHASGVLAAEHPEGSFLERLAKEVAEKGPLAAAGEAEKRLGALAEEALRRAREIEKTLEVRSPGLVPLEPAEPRLHAERIIESAALDGAWTLLLRHRYPEAGELPLDRAFNRELRELKERWREEKRSVPLAEAADYGARLARESGRAYFDAALEALGKSADPEILERYRAEAAAMEETARRGERDAIRGYDAAAVAAEAAGDVRTALVHRGRARALEEAARRRAVKTAAGKKTEE